MTLLSLRRCALVAAALSTASCAGALIGAGAVTGLGVAQERGTKQALSDLDIETSINNALLSKSPELFRRVGVDVIEGRVLLSGAVSRHDHALQVAQTAWSVPGVKAVSNELTIAGDPSFQRYSQDLWITTQLSARMIADPEIASVNYNIETHRGVVHLLGLSRSDAELERVTRLAASVPGVTQVISHVLSIDDPRRQRV